MDVRDALSARQVAQRCGITPTRVRQLAREGALPCVVTPLGSLFHVDDVERFAAQRRDRARRSGRTVEPPEVPAEP